MLQVDSLIHARWVIPVEPENQVLEHHSIVIQHGKILAVLATDQCKRKYTAPVEHTLPGHALVPGFINTHTHAAMVLLRGIADDLPLMEWLEKHIWPAEKQLADYRFVHQGTQIAIAEMLRGGTTTFNDMYFFPDAAAKAAVEAGFRACVGLIMIDFPSAWANDSDEYLHKGLKLHDQYRHHPLISTAFAPHAPYSVADHAFEKIKVYSEELDIPVHIHLHETRHEVEAAEKSGRRPIARLHDLGLLGPRLLAVHMTQLSEQEITLLKENSVNVVHCPESNLKLASGFCPVAKLDRTGINVAMGTDGAASNNDLDMLGEMKTAALLAKAVANDASAIPAARMLTMATLNGARALGIEHITGSLVRGKAADIAAIKLDDLETQPLYHPISQVIYASSRDKVTDVWVQGRHLLNQRRLTTLDEESLYQQLKEWQDKISGYG